MFFLHLHWGGLKRCGHIAGELADIWDNPDAVYIIDSLVGPEERYGHQANRDEGRRIVELILYSGFFNGKKNVNVLLNGVGTPLDEFGFFYPERTGMASNADGLIGIVQGIRSFDDEDVLVSILAGVDGYDVFKRWNFEGAAQFLNKHRCGPVAIRDLNTQISLSDEELDEYRKSGEIPGYNIVDLEGEGVVHSKIPFTRPYGDAHTAAFHFFPLKGHNLSCVTGGAKFVQTGVPRGVQHFCSNRDILRDQLKQLPPHVFGDFVREDWEANVERLHDKHVAANFPFWDAMPKEYPWRSELCADRGGDANIGLKRINEERDISEIYIGDGIVMRNGSGFERGTDIYMGKYVVGMNPFHVDLVIGLLGHHTKVGYLLSSIERGLGKDVSEFPIDHVDAQLNVKRVTPEDVFSMGKDIGILTAYTDQLVQFRDTSNQEYSYKR